MKTKPNDFAFPVSEKWDEDNGSVWLAAMGGMTKREYFAAKIFQGFCSYEQKLNTVNWEKKWAKTAVLMADILIDALNEK